jgi:hypothetical protein
MKGLWSKTRLGIEDDDRSCVWRRRPLQRSLVDRIEGDRKLIKGLLSGSFYSLVCLGAHMDP